MLLFVFSVTALASNIDVPTAALKKGSFGLGLELDMSSRDIKFSNREKGESSLRYLMKGSYGLWDWINLYGIVGGGNIHDGTGFRRAPGLAFGGGIKLRLYEYEDVL